MKTLKNIWLNVTFPFIQLRNRRKAKAKMREAAAWFEWSKLDIPEEERKLAYNLGWAAFYESKALFNQSNL